jgi:quercetin 2,3-dioxygenase
MPRHTGVVSTNSTLHEYLEPRDVLIGRTTHVRRLLPHKERRKIGAWVFLDHYGPDDIKQTGGMWVPPHPHTGLQTVTWLFEGLGRHTDSLGSDQLIRPGQLNVMTAGHGICHAEVSPQEAPMVLHGLQLWVALPEPQRDTAPADFTHLAELPGWSAEGVEVTVMVGSLGGHESPAPAYTPLVGAEIRLEPGASVEVPLREDFEYGVLAVGADVEVDGAPLTAQRLSYLGQGRPGLRLATGDEPAIAVLLGGEPFAEEIVMWWNFIGRSHDEIVEQREAWNGTGLTHVPERFGQVVDFDGDRLLAPPLPNTRLKAR